MFPAFIPNTSCDLSDDASASSISRVQDFCTLNQIVHQPLSSDLQQKIKKKRNLPGNPDPDAEVIALSPRTLMATNRFICEICNKGFQRDQNLQLHRRGHNLPWKLKQRNTKENKKRAYVCPEPSCVHHHPTRALGDLTGIKKHYCRKHGEKKWKCEKCSKIYAVQSDWKAHTKTCGTREYRCHCGTLFSRKDSFITHRAFCDALAEESARLSANSIFGESAAAATTGTNTTTTTQPIFHPNSQIPPPSLFQQHQQLPNPQLNPISHNPWTTSHIQNPNPSSHNINQVNIKHEAISYPFYQETPTLTPHKTNYMGSSPFQTTNFSSSSVPQLSATALLQRASSLGTHPVGHVTSTLSPLDMRNISHVTSGNMNIIPPPFGTWQKSNHDRLTRDFLGLTGDQCSGMGNGNVDVNVNVNMRGVLSFTGSLEFPAAVYERDLSALAAKQHQSFGFVDPNVQGTWRNC